MAGIEKCIPKCQHCGAWQAKAWKSRDIPRADGSYYVRQCDACQASIDIGPPDVVRDVVAPQDRLTTKETARLLFLSYRLGLSPRQVIRWKDRMARKQLPAPRD